MAGRGGPRQPRNPAPVSNPGSGRRTDGGAGSKSQPLRAPSGGAYGERKATLEQQAAAPMAGAGPTGGAGAPAPPVAPGAPPQGGVFGPTTQPNVPSSGMVNGPMKDAASDPDHFLRILYSQFPTPAIGALLRRGGNDG